MLNKLISENLTRSDFRLKANTIAEVLYLTTSELIDQLVHSKKLTEEEVLDIVLHLAQLFCVNIIGMYATATHHDEEVDDEFINQINILLHDKLSLFREFSSDDRMTNKINKTKKNKN